MRRVLGLFVAIAVFACSMPEIQNISCRDDDTCPTGYVCSGVGSCVAGGPEMAPHLVLDGVKQNERDAPASSVTVKAGALTDLYAHLSDPGGLEVDYPTITLTSDACLHVHDIAKNEIGVIRAHGETDAQFYVDPDATCLGSHAVHADMVAKVTNLAPERRFTADFTVVVE